MTTRARQQRRMQDKRPVRITLLHLYIEQRFFPKYWPAWAIEKRLIEQGYDHRIRVLEAK